VENSLEVRKRIGYLPEHPPLYLDRSVKSYLEFTARIKGIEWKRVRSHVDTVVEKCGLQKYYRAQCNSLSKGYRQRVGIAQALIHEPMVLILDEPTIGLDPIQIVEIRELIKTFGGEHTVILSTHILPEVDVTCEDVIIINDGAVVTQGSTKNLRDRLPSVNHLILTVRGETPGFRSRLDAIDGIENISCEPADDNKAVFTIKTDSAETVSPSIARAVVEENMELIELRSMAPTLEEIFIKATMN
jgi:ABC-2 type transport system ATP-binding protein